jgi:glc operon protein GlcG
MNTKFILGVTEINDILAAARAEAERHGWAVSIAVVDDGGHPLGLLRLDGAAPSSAYIATEKARTSALGRRESKVYEDMINNGRIAFLSAPLSGTLEGGVPIVVEGQCLGAVGVSGVKSDQDAAVAKAGVARVPQPAA